MPFGIKSLRNGKTTNSCSWNASVLFSTLELEGATEVLTDVTEVTGVALDSEIFGSEEDLMETSPDLAEFKFHNRCKFCERRFDSSGEMGRHNGFKHTRDGGRRFLWMPLSWNLETLDPALLLSASFVTRDLILVVN